MRPRGRRGEAGQTTTEYLMISGIMTAVAIAILRVAILPPQPQAACAPMPCEMPRQIQCGSAFTIQCVLQRITDDMINEPGR